LTPVRARRLCTAVITGVAMVAGAVGLAGCGGASSTPQATLHGFLTDWSHGDWTAARRLVSSPPASFVTANTAAFTALGVHGATFAAGRVRTSGSRASAPVTEHFTLPEVGAWSPRTTIHLVQRNGRWLVAWTPATINPALRAGVRLATTRDWPARAAILGAGGAPLTADRQLVTVGVVGSRIKNPQAVRADLIAAGAPPAGTTTALAAAKAHPTFFEPIFQVSPARFAQLKAQPGAGNVYAVPGTQFELAGTRSAITAQLAAHVVGTVGPITAEQLHTLGSLYDSASRVGQTGVEQAYERRLAGLPTTKVVVLDAGGATAATLATFSGQPGQTVRTSIDPTVQRAAEAALAGVRRKAAMVAMRASTGQVLAVVSDPVSYAYDQALQGEYPPGSTFKVLTTTALIQKGLSPTSPATCPPSLDIDGEVFHNAEGDQPVQTLDQAFTESCNTAFIGLATAHLTARDFTNAADLYGLQRIARPGLPAFDAYVPAPGGRTALGATAIGQAGVVFSPLGMAAVAAAIDSGTVRAPGLVQGSPDDQITPQPLPAAVAADLRLMMGHVVASGTAAGTGLPSTTHAKTGTAQYGTGSQLKIDAWLMGYDGDIAFAVVVQNSGGANGGPLDGPIIAKFLNALGTGA
jgi:cell division protein FtsI/penicillin-binding protein 2